MAKRKTETAPETEEPDLMAVVEATDPKAPETATDEVAAETATPMPEAPASVVAPAMAPARRGGAGSSFLGMVLGGVIAAGAGFGLARLVPDLLPLGASGPDPAIAAQAQEIAALREQVAALTGKAQPGPATDERLAAVEQAMAGLDARVAAAEQAVAEVPAQASAGGVSPELAAEVAALKEQVARIGTGGAVPADVTAAVEAAETRLKEAEARAADLARQAEEAAALARRAAALDRIAAALDSGAAYAAALRDIDGTLPPVLADHAAAGLPTIASLRDSFPAAARDGLEAALRANMGESWTDRVSNFLRSQTGLRSLTPREGDDPDAVLSRAEAALEAGDVAGALAELDRLPDAAKPALADWTASARVRLEAEAAFATLAAN